MKVFGAVKKKVSQLVKSKDSISYKSQNKDKLQKEKQIIYIPPITIDDVTFSTTEVTSEKDIPKMEKKLLKLYNKEYLQECQQQRLCIEIVGLKNFTKVIKTTQKYYKHNNNGRLFSQKFLEKAWQIYTHPTLMKHFWSIDFSKLKVMNISRHNLSSIEGITFMELPNLICLEIHSNNLISIDCFSKVSFPKLQTLTLYNNSIKKVDKINRVKLPQLKNIELDTYKHNYHKNTENLNFVFKCQRRHIKKLYAQDQNRIMSKKFYKKLINYCSIISVENMPDHLVLNYCNVRVHMNREVWDRERWGHFQYED